MKTACIPQNTGESNTSVDPAARLSLCNMATPTYSRLIAQNNPSVFRLKPTVTMYCEQMFFQGCCKVFASKGENNHCPPFLFLQKLHEHTCRLQHLRRDCPSADLVSHHQTLQTKWQGSVINLSKSFSAYEIVFHNTN